MGCGSVCHGGLHGKCVREWPLHAWAHAAPVAHMCHCSPGSMFGRGQLFVQDYSATGLLDYSAIMHVLL